MSNIAVGGYGGDSAGGGYADIDWSKQSYSLIFQIANTHDVQFNITHFAPVFGIQTLSNIFNINTHNETFNIESHDIRFTSNLCS